MRPLKIPIVITAAGVILALLLILGGKTRNQIKRMETLDTMGQISAALDRALPTNQWQTIDPDKAVRSAFPRIPRIGRDVVDAWGRPITISIETVQQGFAVDIISSGPDGVIGTKDDLVWSELILFKRP